MGTTKLPEGIKLKMLLNNFSAYQNSSRGLLYEDHMRIASHLEKIARLPLLGDTIHDYIHFQLGTSPYTHRTLLPFRQVHLISSVEQGINRPVGYKIHDEVHEVCPRSDQTMDEAIAQWYLDTGIYGSLPHFVGIRTMTLDELD